MLPIALSLIAGGAVYLIGKISSSGGQRGIIEHGGTAMPFPVTPQAPVTPVARAPVVEPKPAPVEVKPPPPTPKPPPDTSASLPTPPLPAPIATPPLIERPIQPLPVPVAAAPKVTEPVKVPVEVTPPPPPPTPPPDSVASLPTPPPTATTAPVTDRNWGPTIDVPVGDKYADAAQATPAVPATPSKPAGSQLPAGFDGALASALAPGLATHIASKGYDFDRTRLKTFQTAAGLTPDGVYGNDSWGALLYFTSDAPKALYKPSMPTPYPWGAYIAQSPAAAPASAAPIPVVLAPAAPPPVLVAPPDMAQVGPVPPAGFNPTQARSLAKGIASNIDTKGSSYDRTRLKTFQTAAGIDADGIYGGGSRRALIFYGVPRPPAALFKPTATPATYPWEAQANAWSGT